MRGAFLIAMREVRERRVVLAAALVAGLLPFSSPLLPGVAAGRAAEARDAMAAILAVGLGLILTLVLGATAVARDLSENRLGFDFARPVGALSIWAGRLAAAVGLTLITMVIVVVPAALVGGRVWLPDRAEALLGVLVALIASVLLGVGLAHGASVAFRSRSRWLALDLTGLVGVTLLVGSAVRRFQDAFAPQTALAAGAVAVLAMIPALWIASAVQVVRGRTDIVLGHRAQSIALWSMLGVVAIGLSGYSLWWVAANVDDLVYAWAGPAPQGPWITLSGSAAGRPGLAANFLFDTDSGRTVRLAPGDLGLGNATLFSRDGRRAVSLHRESAADTTISAGVLDLGSPDPHLRWTSIEFSLLMPMRLDLSPSGARLATLQGRNLAVHDLDTGRILAAVMLDEVEQRWGGTRVAFVDENRLRVYALRGRLVAHELDVDRRTVSSWTGPEVGNESSDLSWRADHDRLILADPGATGVVLLEGRTGATIARLGPPDRQSTGRVSFLSDGRIVRIAERSPGRATLDVLSTDGLPLRSHDIGTVDPSRVFWLGAEASPGTVLVHRRAGVAHDPGRLMLVDLETGRIRDVEGGGAPVAAMSWVAQYRPAEPGSVAARLVQRGRSVWLVDPESATLRPVAGHRD